MKRLILSIFFLIQASIVFAGPLKIGTTFSPVQCAYLGLNWRETYLSILEMGFDLIRLGAYWNEIEKEQGVYDFSKLDWQVKEARKRDIPVVLTVGMKAPRWPEYFIPDWVMEKVTFSFGADVSKSAYLKEHTLKFIEAVVERYKKEATIRYWQVENEPLNRFGGEYWVIGKNFLIQEIELVKRIDGEKRPVILTTATYPNKLLRFTSGIFIKHDPIEECLEMCDILGLNVYPVVGHKFLGLNFYFRTNKKEKELYFSKLLAKARDAGKEAWIVEFQAEPWEAGRLVYKENKKPSSIRIDSFEESFQEVREIGFDVILLWGAEHWHFRHIQRKDPEWKEKIQNILMREKDFDKTPDMS